MYSYKYKILFIIFASYFSVLSGIQGIKSQVDNSINIRNYLLIILILNMYLYVLVKMKKMESIISVSVDYNFYLNAINTYL